MKIVKPELRLTFEGEQLDVYHVNGQRWVGGVSIAHALGLDTSAVKHLYRQNRHEITPEMTAIITVLTPGGPQPVRMYSPRGVALIVMKSNSPKAPAFRTGFLDVLEGKVPPPLAAPLTPALSHEGRGGAPLAALARQLSAANAELLRANQVWGRIAHYRRIGLSQRETAKLLDMDKSTIRVHVRRMEACGILTPPANLAALQGNVLNFRRAPELDGPHG